MRSARRDGQGTSSYPEWVTSQPALLWLAGARDGPELVAAQQAPLQKTTRLITPRQYVVVDAGRLDLPGTAREVARSVVEAGLTGVTVCGISVGVLAGLQLAADHPGLVAAAVLIPGPSQAPTPIRSVREALLRLLPTTAAPRLGMSPPDALAHWDLARPADFRRLAARVVAPTAVLVGGRDQGSLAPSRLLASLLPQGRLRTVPGAGPSWQTERPELLGHVVREVLAELGG